MQLQSHKALAAHLDAFGKHNITVLQVPLYQHLHIRHHAVMINPLVFSTDCTNTVVGKEAQVHKCAPALGACALPETPQAPSYVAATLRLRRPR